VRRSGDDDDDGDNDHAWGLASLDFISLAAHNTVITTISVPSEAC
jgi:hypothetical protein